MPGQLDGIFVHRRGSAIPNEYVAHVRPGDHRKYRRDTLLLLNDRCGSRSRARRGSRCCQRRPRERCRTGGRNRFGRLRRRRGHGKPRLRPVCNRPVLHGARGVRYSRQRGRERCRGECVRAAIELHSRLCRRQPGRGRACGHRERLPDGVRPELHVERTAKCKRPPRVSFVDLLRVVPLA